MLKEQIHLINYSGPKIKHWKAILMEDENTYRIFSGTDVNNLSTTEKTHENSTFAYFEMRSEIHKKLEEGFMYINKAPSGQPNELLYLLSAPNKSGSTILDIHPNGKILAIGSQKWESPGVEIHLQDLDSGLLTLLYSIDGLYVKIHSIHFNITGDKIFFLLDTAVKILDINTKQVRTLAIYTENVDGPAPNYCPPVMNTARNRYLYFSAGAVNVCDELLASIFELKLEKPCKLACISPAGRLLALHYTGTDILHSSIDIWDIDNNKLLNSIEVTHLEIDKMAINPAETEIAFRRSPESGPGFYDLKTGELLRWFYCPYKSYTWELCFDFAYSPNGKLFAFRHYLLDAQFEKFILPSDLLGEEKQWKIIFSADSKYFIEGGDTGRIAIRQAGSVHSENNYPFIKTGSMITETLMKQYVKLYGQPDHIIDVKEAITFQLAVFDPNEEEDVPDTTITSIGLSPHAKNRFEIQIDILGKPSEKTMAEIGPFLYKLFEKLKNETVTEGNICTDIPVPSFGQMDAQWIYVANDSDHLSGPDGIQQILRVFPLFKEEAEALEQASPHLRLLVMKWHYQLYANPGRETIDIFHLTMAGLWEIVAGEYEKIGAKEAALLHERLKSAKKSDFTKLEAELGISIPPDFKASLAFHQNMEIEECRMYSQEEMLDLWRRMKELNDSGQFDPARDKIPDDERMKHVWWHEKWIPIAVDVWNNDYVVIDMDPGPKGVVGQVLIWNRFEGAFYRFDSFYEWIQFLDFGLARGIYTFHEDGKLKNPDGGGGMYP